MYLGRLLTFILVSAFTLLYLGNAIPKKPAPVEKAITMIKENINYLAMGGVIFGVIAVLIVPLMYYHPVVIFTNMFADLVLILMAAPFAFERILKDHEAKINTAILGELKKFMGWITGHSTIVGGVGVLAAVLLIF
jgi:hypothetical protein